MDEAKEDLAQLIWGQAARRAAQGDVSYVRELGAQVADRHAAAVEQMRDHAHQLAHLMRVLAITPGRDSVEQLVRLLHEKNPHGSPAIMPAFMASLLAEHQQTADLADVVFDRFGREGLDELRACLFHELVLRGVDTDAHLHLHYWPIVRPGGHPLAWLPPSRRELEALVDFPTRSIGGSAFGVATGLPAEGRVDPPTPRTSERSALRDVATQDVHETIVGPVEAGRWGHGDAWVFLLDEPLAPDRVPALLPTLPMPCVEGLGATNRFEVAVRPPTAIWRLLFGTASMGGMYGQAAHGAYGRLRAWRSMGALSGAPLDARAEEVERQVMQSTWFHFEADAEWFHNEIGNDYGVAALSPDRRRIAVLAATDTD
uniref:DUF6183 family protein n=1 Tax=Streptomyces sp. NBC_00049 TaxID=2903617 RepID=A0AAU2JZT0_9ACTN